jgi:outer membrane lipoprotein-sorting protein
MKKITFLLPAFLFFIFVNISLSQEENQISEDSTLTPQDTTVLSQQEPDSTWTAIMVIVNEVNRLSETINNINGMADIFIKTPKIGDAEGEIEVRAKKPDDFWFAISGSVAFISKDAFFGHFNRKNFLYFNNLEDYSIQGPTTDNNIGYVIRIKATFDDMMNGLTGTVKISVSEKDTLSISEDNNYYYLKAVSKEYNRQYWIRKSDYLVTQYEYYNAKKQKTLTMSFSDFWKSGESSYAKKITIKRGSEELRLSFKTYQTNVGYLNFKVDVPYDAKKIVWTK